MTYSPMTQTFVTPPTLTLISHPLCPYVQRAAIALAEKGLRFTRRDIDLAAKPDWFLALSPLGKTPVLLANDTAIFESAVILEYLEETTPRPLHPVDPLSRARHRGWIEYASATLADIAALYSADAASFPDRLERLTTRLARLEDQIKGPFFDGDFSLVDAAFAPVFRYFSVFVALGLPQVVPDLPRLTAWQHALTLRPSVAGAVAVDYPQRLAAFVRARTSYLGELARSS
jgi:glutathione S-transferase